MGKHGYNKGDIGWNEMTTSDAEAAAVFYSELFGWERHDGPKPGYHVMGNGPEILAGITGPPEEGATPKWTPFVTVEDVDAAAKKVTALGGTLVGEPVEMPSVGRYILFRDPQGGQTVAIQYANNPDENA